jgi:hypothetical protein
VVEILFADKPSFEAWLKSLDDETQALATKALAFLLENRHALPEYKRWTKSLGSNFLELRIGPTYGHVERLVEYSSRVRKAKERLLLRVFIVELSSNCFLVLSGYDKLADLSSERQRFEIAKAQRLYKGWTNKSEVF